jgi:hypothetical protein
MMDRRELEAMDNWLTTDPRDKYEDETCPWCGEDITMQGGLEAHISEPCDEYLAELNAGTCRNCDKPINYGMDLCGACDILTDGGRQMRPPASDN